MIQVPISPRLKAVVDYYAKTCFPVNNDPHPNNIFGTGDPTKDMVGILGEVLVARYICSMKVLGYLAQRPVRQSDIGYDLWFCGHRVDVKTLFSKVKPDSRYYRYNVAKVQLDDERYDWLMFCTVLEDFSQAYIAGYISKEAFLRKAQFHRKGEVVEKNGFKFPCDAYDIALGDLNGVN